MKRLNFSLFAGAAALALLLPAPTMHSQLAAPADPLAAIQEMDKANTDLIKRQEATLQDLTEMTDTAREVRLFSKRG